MSDRRFKEMQSEIDALRKICLELTANQLEMAEQILNLTIKAVDDV